MYKNSPIWDGPFWSKKYKKINVYKIFLIDIYLKLILIVVKTKIPNE